MNIINAIIQLRDDLKTWVTNNLKALDAKIDSKTIPIDLDFDINSTNPVQNQTITREINTINDKVGTSSVSEQIDKAISSQYHFNGDYNSLTNAPSITENEESEFIIADEFGNIIFKVNAEGTYVTKLIINGQVIDSIGQSNTSTQNSIILKSSTANSSKKFELSIDDDGIISTKELTE